ncbi:TetR family transcriptional regulator [Paraburkholderia sp. BL6665CI2N2]|uniref:TetR/AcrR family transcriptional regulator n=1 Tax=Paraburkholderia sp. BL6665CI2N2 TaxID=1938806 RepID=UPI0010E46DD7|nr:TetR/AcrR family transcriptional regulator [Paraburkholderia sp. BL6665CI2N2]TDY22042.1 TetR family transcriptional regulator [Paraburkholderia sp. BL6665CI2N2]
MSDIGVAIMDAAERRMRIGGLAGFSFREIAADVGIKSSSVHYHFPTKENLAAAVIRRYTDHVAEVIDQQFELDPDPIRVWIEVFRGTLFSEDRMCPATVLGAAALDLPAEVAAEVKCYFTMAINKLVKEGLSDNAATQFLTTLVGALVVSNALGDPAAYDRATEGLLGERNTHTY